ncbi:hypothetical protein SAY86_005008 [Trapa natans]|uniref:Uncharacterized protein n=1 Tax=Trapa natans TaxID=22666 RepID=A0AAN7L752_TRANT|nr:hypothetical protein SAY86_005008 [Trapa natans]
MEFWSEWQKTRASQVSVRRIGNWEIGRKQKSNVTVPIVHMSARRKSRAPDNNVPPSHAFPMHPCRQLLCLQAKAYASLHYTYIFCSPLLLITTSSSSTSSSVVRMDIIFRLKYPTRCKHIYTVNCTVSQRFVSSSVNLAKSAQLFLMFM